MVLLLMKIVPTFIEVKGNKNNIKMNDSLI